MTYRLIAEPAHLTGLTNQLQNQSTVALDCEAAGFHRYTDRLCLVQLSTSEETLLFDPLAIDPADTLRPALEDPKVKVVMHGADFDLRLLHRDLSIRVRGLFDTQIAASLLGASAIGLASLLEEHLDVKLSKKHQRADWATRPLAEEMLDYAAGDTRHLLALAGILSEELQAAGRSGWAEEEFRALETIEWVGDQTDPVTRFKGARHMGPREVTRLRRALEWRDQIARSWDRAPFRVAGDPVLISLVVERPRSVRELASVKGMSSRLANTHGQELLGELEKVDGLHEEELEPFPRRSRNGPGRLTPEEEAQADGVRALRTSRAKELGLDKGVLLSNAQIMAIVRAVPPSLEALRALKGIRGWQAEQLGSGILKILAS